MKDKKIYQMYTGLKIITKYNTLAQLKRESRMYSLSYEETLEMAYENIKSTAKYALKGIKLKEK